MGGWCNPGFKPNLYPLIFEGRGGGLFHAQLGHCVDQEAGPGGCSVWSSKALVMVFLVLIIATNGTFMSIERV